MCQSINPIEPRDIPRLSRTISPGKHTPTNEKGRKRMNFTQFYKTNDLPRGHPPSRALKKPGGRTYGAHFPQIHAPTNKKGANRMNFIQFYKKHDLPHAHPPILPGGLMAHKAHTFPKTTTQTSNPRATMRAFLQPKLRVCLRGPGRHIAKRANRINRLIRINPINKLMKMHAFPGIVDSHAWVPDNRGCIA